MAKVLAVLGRGAIDPEQPIIRADDLGVLRGDGIFETLNVRGGEMFLLREHLVRMAASARRTEIDLPPYEALDELSEQARQAWLAHPDFDPDAEAALRIVATRGLEHGSEPTVYATIDPVPRERTLPRRDGLQVLTASSGVNADTRGQAPWLLGGAKLLSYATTMAVMRWAKSLGADDALWVTADGYCLEGPTSSLVWRDKDVLCTTPTDTGILPGTTSTYLLQHASKLGLRSEERLITPEKLTRVDGVWMTSSVRGVAFVTTLDGQELATDPEMHSELVKLSGFELPS
ncbi:aminotransferase class IV [Natronoglycomyces albus]|uniref:Aminotransferase class IV n=1 Tax=Natronoglycomyces albus TaxID=2811108 RepID=A0A895XPP1_9ACTN|nr:aminotransferase class IV [Natronoglycomyces albus]QSB05339.1 aminotransferase class IV [Natronoglycomyces albus]